MARGPDKPVPFGYRPLTPEQSKEARRLRRLKWTWREIGDVIGASHTRVRKCIRAEDLAAQGKRLQAEASRRANARPRTPDGEAEPALRIEAVIRRVPNRGNSQSSSENTHFDVSLPRVRFLEMRV